MPLHSMRSSVHARLVMFTDRVMFSLTYSQLVCSTVRVKHCVKLRGVGNVTLTSGLQDFPLPVGLEVGLSPAALVQAYLDKHLPQMYF